ncbi:MAG: hypothetical protein LBF04_01980 [Prevotellaceae bacterium]|jgi:hypothetical protein|nr:hypothetical protein [Prevotellaceae bacterium]
MRKILNFKVTAKRHIGGKRETERYENGILTKIVSGKVRKIENTKLHRTSDGTFVRTIDDRVQDKEFEVSKSFYDVSWLDISPKERKQKEQITLKQVATVIIKFSNNKIIEKGESVIISSKSFPSAVEIGEAFRDQLGKTLKGSLSIDFFTIEKI